MPRKKKILILDGVNSVCAAMLRRAGYSVKERKSLSGDSLSSYDAVVIRSATKLTDRMLRSAAERLRLVVRVGAGVDNIDLDAATRCGILVENTPGTNARAVVELTMGALIAMARRIIPAHLSLKNGKWEKSRFRGTELHGKTLGIIGVGRIGQGVAAMARGFGMEVLGYDPLMTPEKAEELQIKRVSLNQLLRSSDYITLHAALTHQSRHLLNGAAFKKMKKGVCIANCARAELVDRKALLEALDNGTVAYYFADVFEQEPPPPDDELIRHERVLVTPHLGGSTMESSLEGARMAARQIAAYFERDEIINAVNFAPGDPALRDWEALSEKLGSFLYQFLDDQSVSRITIEYRGGIASRDTNRVAASFFLGMMKNISDAANIVNARRMVEDEGIDVTESRTAGKLDQIVIRFKTNRGEVSVTGACVLGKPVLQSVNEYTFDMPLEDKYFIISEHSDVPGIVGIIGTALGKNMINIEKMGLKDIRGKPSMAIITTREPTPRSVLKQITEEVRKKGGEIKLRHISL